MGQRTRQSIERAIAGGATNAELVVLQGVVYWSTTFSRATDRVSLGQIAQTAAMWRGAPKDCPRWVTKRLVERLRRLEELGAVTYVPGHGGAPSTIGFPPLEEGPQLHRGTSIDDRERGAASAPLPPPEEGSTQSPPERGAATAPESAQEGSSQRSPGRGAASAPPPEDDPRTSVRGSVRGTPRNGSAVGSLAARLTACATTDAPGTDREAQRVAELVLEHLPVDVALEALDHLADAGTIRRPGAVLVALELVADDDQAEAVDAIQSDRRFRALAGAGPAYAIADACPGPWTEHLDEAELVADHFDRHRVPAGIVGEVLEEIARGGLKRPGHAARIARRLAAALDVDVPALDLPPARRIRRSPSP